MEFGKVEDSEIGLIDFTLPPDGVFPQRILPGKRDPALKVHIGCAKWGRKEWIGSLYPKGTRESEFLDQYVKHFGCIELNATHYKIYPEATIRKWAEKAKNEDFKFCPKVPQTISHYSDLGSTKAHDLTSAFLEGIYAFGDKLGPVFLQISERYAPLRKHQLFTYLARLPKDIRFFLEVRHSSWFSDPEIRQELFGTLMELGIGAVITDASGRRDCAHMELSTPEAFIRFVGNGLHPTDYQRVDDWVQRMHSWIEKGISEIWFFMHQHDERYSPQLCDYVIKQLNAVCGLSVKGPEFIGSSGSLFD